jgi:hypothetical protein
MKRRLIILFTAVFLIITAHRLPAPISEGLETPTPAPASTSTPKPAPQEPSQPKPKTTKPKPKHVDNEAPAKRATPEPPKAPVTGAWHGHWDNSRGESGGVKVTLTEGAGGTITGDGGPGKIENGHRTGNVVTYTFHRWGRDYQVTLNLSVDGTTMSGGYKVTQGQKLIYTGKYDNFRR